MCQTSPDIRFTNLGAPRRIWAISAVHGEFEKLYALHDALLPRLSAGDRIVYLGNVTGRGAHSRETVDEVLTFRRLALAQPGIIASDIVYVRGQQEHMWQNLLQLPFTNQPLAVLSRLLAEGLGPTLESYDISADDGMRACKEGVLALTRWTGKIRAAIRAHAGHDIFFSLHRRAAFTQPNGAAHLLFIHSGLDPRRPLEDQGETLWAAGDDFYSLTERYGTFAKVIRGYDPSHNGVRINCVTASLDGGAGFGGELVCAGFDPDGNIQELLHA